MSLELKAPSPKASSRAVKGPRPMVLLVRGEAVARLPHAPIPMSPSRRAPRAVVKTTSRGPFREVEAVAKVLGGHFSKAKGTSRPPSRVVEWTTVRGPCGAVCS